MFSSHSGSQIGESAERRDRVIRRRLRVLHVVGGLNRGGTETWLMNVLRHVDRTTFQMDFLVHTDGEGAYDREAVSLGAKLHRCAPPTRLAHYARDLRRHVDEGAYDILHGHMHDFSGIALWLTRGKKIGARVVHSHSDTSTERSRAKLMRRGYLAFTRRCIERDANLGIAASNRAAAALFGRQWQQDSRWRVIHCGIDLDAFRATVDRDSVRSGLGIPSSAFVIGHVGRFAPVKNHALLLDIAAQVRKKEPNTWLLLIGDGQLKEDIRRQAQRLGIEKYVVFAGARSDVPRMLNAMDVFVFPSFYEGLPVSCLEAQAAGLPLFLSDSVTSEVVVADDLVIRISPRGSALDVANTILETRSLRKSHLSDRLVRLERSSFSITKSIHALTEAYYSALG